MNNKIENQKSRIDAIPINVLNIALNGLSVGAYYRFFARDGTNKYLYFNKIVRDFFRNEDVPASPYWKQDNDDRDDEIVSQTDKPLRVEYPMSSLDDPTKVIRWLVFVKKKMEVNDTLYGEGYCIVTTVVDVSERKKEEIAAKKAQINLQLSLTAGKMSAWDFDVETQSYTILNGVDVHNNVISREDHLKLRHDDEEVSQSNDKTWMQVTEGAKEKAQTIFSVKDKTTGEILYRQSYFKGIRIDGKVRHVLGVTQDITENYRQKIELKNSRNELYLALEAGNLAVWRYNAADKMFTTIYGRALAGDGLSKEQLSNIIHPDDRDVLFSLLDTIISRRNSIVSSVVRFEDNSVIGGYRYYDSKIIGILDRNGRLDITGTQRDVTEEYLRQEQMEEYKLKTTLVNKALNIIQWDYDIARHALLTYTENSIMPHQLLTLEKYLNFVHPKDHDLVKNLFAKADRKALNEFSFEIDLQIPGKEGYSRVSATGVAVRDKKGAVVKYTGIRRDISEWVRLNKELKDRLRMDKLVVNNLDAGLLFFSKDCRIIWSNINAQNYYSKVMGKRNVYPGDYCDCWLDGKCTDPELCLVKKAIETNQILTEERLFGDLYLTFFAVPVSNEDGKMMGALLKLHDVSEEKRYTRELKQLKEKAENTSALLNKILEKMWGALYIKDPSNGYRYTKVNSMFCFVTGHSAEEVVGRDDYELFGEEVGDKYRAFDMELFKSGKRSVSYDMNIALNGKMINWHVSKSIVEIENKRFILAIALDVSELQRVNKELEEAKLKAQQSDRLKSAFLANMSHEIRTPLNAIVGFSDILANNETSEADKEEFSRIITSNTDILLRLINDILDLSKIEAGTIEMKRELVDVSSFFTEITKSLAPKFVNPDVVFIVDNPYKSCFINIDKSRFGQVLINFVTNAIKYTAKGYVKAGYYIEKQGLTIRVEDTGIGIAPEKRNRVFTRFDKLDSMAQGTGLGLSIAKALTEIGGGRIWFESTPGKGSTFYSWKPFADIRFVEGEPALNIVDNEPIQQRLIESNVIHKINRILIAEDNHSNYLLLYTMLEDYLIDWAKDGAEAVDMVARKNYDLILMDIQMPIMNGLDAVRQIRKFNRSVPIVAVSANAFSTDEHEALEAGCNSYLRKPVIKEHLYRIISKM